MLKFEKIPAEINDNNDWQCFTWKEEKSSLNRK